MLRKKNQLHPYLKKLEEMRISSAPVKCTETNEFIGTVDTLDMLTLCVAKFDFVLTEQTLKFEMDKFLKKEIKHLIGISGRDTWLPVSENVPLSDAIRILSELHRVAVIKNSTEVTGIVTQWGAIDFIYRNRFSLGIMGNGFLSQKVEKLMRKEVVTIKETRSVLDGFKLIWESRVSGLAVVNSSGKLVGNVSASDLKKAHFNSKVEMILDIFQSIKNFMHIHHCETGRGSLPIHLPIYVIQEDSIGKVIELVVCKHVHRVYVVDQKINPIGVLSLGDILKLFVHE